jgi:hypothetical protein
MLLPNGTGSSSRKYYFILLHNLHTLFQELCDQELGCVLTLLMKVVCRYHYLFYLDYGCHLGCSAMYSGKTLPTFQVSSLPPSSGQ